METETLPQVVEDRSLVFGTAEPSGIIQKATKIADALVPLIEKKKLYKTIGPKKHVYVEGWNTMLAMLGVFPSLVHSHRLDRSEEIAYSARVELRHVSGAVVGAGEALCSSFEANWKNKDEFQISSMAQTRATGKAARLSFSWIMNLAGYAEVPAEEMTEAEKETAREAIREPEAKPVDPSLITDAQRKRFFAIWKGAGKSEADVRAKLKEAIGSENSANIPKDKYEALCAWANLTA